MQALAAIDAAILSLGRNAPLYRLTLERQGALDVRDLAGTFTHLARVESHLEWVQPLDL